MKVVIIQPPIVQLNTPYPSGAYLQDFFKKLKSFGETDNQITTFTQSPTLSQNAFKKPLPEQLMISKSMKWIWMTITKGNSLIFIALSHQYSWIFTGSHFYGIWLER